MEIFQWRMFRWTKNSNAPTLEKQRKIYIKHKKYPRSNNQRKKYKSNLKGNGFKTAIY